MICLELNIKYWTSPDLNSMRWLRLFTNKTFRKHRKLIFLHRDFIICIALLAIFHPYLSSAFFYPHFTVRIFPSAFFIIRNFPSAFFYPPSSIRRHPVRTLQRPSLKGLDSLTGRDERTARAREKEPSLYKALLLARPEPLKCTSQSH